VTKLVAPGLWLEAPRGLVIHPSDNIDMLRAMARDSLVQLGARVDTTAGLMALMDRAGDQVALIRRPTLVLFGAHEEILPKQAVAAFLDNLPAQNVRVALYPDGYHMLLRDLSAPIVWRDILAWIADRSQPLPSGDECHGEAAQSAPCRASGR
jgi:alpha-beta hydrolase superfamily lysophospholipase